MTEPTKMTDTKDASPPAPIESLPLVERVKLAEKTDPYVGIAPGWFIDARDTVNNWCMAEVLRIDGPDVKVGFDGWSSKYDDVIVENETDVGFKTQIRKGVPVQTGLARVHRPGENPASQTRLLARPARRGTFPVCLPR